MTITTSPNILTTIDIPFTGLNAKSNRWEIKYSIKKTNLIEGVTSTIVGDRTISIFDTPETPILDEEGNQTGTNPATTELTDFMASWSDLATLIDQSYQRVLAHEGIVEWSDDTIDEIENSPDAETPVEWNTLIGVLIAPPNKVIFNNDIYSVVQAHTVQSNWTPNIVPALYSYISPIGGGNELQPWEPWGGSGALIQTGEQRSHNGLCWESAVDNNSWEPGADGVGDNIWFQITCP